MGVLYQSGVSTIIALSVVSSMLVFGIPQLPPPPSLVGEGHGGAGPLPVVYPFPPTFAASSRLTFSHPFRNEPSGTKKYPEDSASKAFSLKQGSLIQVAY